jgi:hypothetical protein
MRAPPTISRRGRGRPKGHVKLLDHAGRFEAAAWHAFTTGLGMKPYEAAYLVAFLASDRPITTESVDGVLLRSSTLATKGGRVIGHADRIRRWAPEAVERADDHELAWLAQSAGLIVALVKFGAAGNVVGIETTLYALQEAGWAETIRRVTGRIGASLQSNFPPAEGTLSRAAARLLHRTRLAAE